MIRTLCSDESRRQRVRQGDLNGLDYVEVALTDDHGREMPQPVLSVFFLGKAPAQPVTAANILLEGGRRISGNTIAVVDVEMLRNNDPELDDCMQVRVSRSGDWSPYTLRLVDAEDGRSTDRDFPGFDQRYSRTTFTFTAECPSDLDCRTTVVCPSEPYEDPEISYLAKDYSSFRQLILDRLALVMPNWREQHVPDLGITLVELLAYVGDYLSYQQDAVATEAYLETARQRISVRRHARLVDYLMHDGCNARAWVCVETAVDLTAAAADVYFITGHNQALEVAGTVLVPADLERIPRSAYEVFEPAAGGTIDGSIHLYHVHNELRFYTWGRTDCCLARGATAATLRDAWASSDHASTEAPRTLHLTVGDVLILEEVIGPTTGDPADADPTHRHAVRLTSVTPGIDALFDPPVPVVDIAWASEDRLPFTFCISTVPNLPGCAALCDVSVARGNVVLVDHGQSIRNEPLGEVGVEDLCWRCDGPGESGEVLEIAAPFSPVLGKSPLTCSEPLASGMPASRVVVQDPRKAVPAVQLTSIPGLATQSGEYAPLLDIAEVEDPARGAVLVAELAAVSDARIARIRMLLPAALVHAIDAIVAPATPPDTLVQQVMAALRSLLQGWTPVRDLLESGELDRMFVAEVDNDQRVHLRFGDGDLGSAPAVGATFSATYRVGNGIVGHVGAEAISRIVFEQPVSGGVIRVRNPLASQGGVEPEAIADVKLLAPTAIRSDRQRAITADDYADLTDRDFAQAVQRAAASLRWTGSWYEAHVTVDPFGTDEERRGLDEAVLHRLYRYRRIGHDLLVRPAQYVPLDIELTVCVKPNYVRGHVEGALLDLFSNRVQSGGRLGFFHPDNLTFGDDIFVSTLAATAQAVTGVASADVTRLKRRFAPANGELVNGMLELGPEEVAQVDNDPDFPEHGRFSLVMKGGR